MPYTAAQVVLQRTPSPTPYNYNLFDRQVGTPRPGNAFLDRPGITFLFPITSTVVAPTADGRYTVVPSRQLSNVIAVSPRATVRFDTAFDSARLASVTNPAFPGGFFPSTIPVRGDPTFGLGQHVVVTTPSISSQFGLTASADAGAFGPALFVTDLAAAATSTDFQSAGSSVSFLHLYGQLGNFYVGKTDTAFSDVDAFPATINPAGPNAAVYVQHAALGYTSNLWENPRSTLLAAVAVEAPETSTTAYDSANARNFFSRSQLPDFAGRLRLTDRSWGHVQVATVLREVGIENATYKPMGLPTVPVGHSDAFGWGMMLSGAVHPLWDADESASDYLSFSTIYGRGIGNYILDLRALGGFDGFLDARGKLNPLPVFTYYLGYTHYWSPKWRTTAAYSEVNAYSTALAAAAPSPYRRGRYASINLVYFFSVTSPGSTEGTADPKTAPGRGFAGIEYMYGDRTNLNASSGNNHRIEFAAGYQF